MPESLQENQTTNLIFQERHQWYQISHFLHKLAVVAEELKLRPEDIVHIGGTANYYRCYETFGPAAAMHFRGTRDMDLISFRQGAIQNVIERIASLPNSPINNFEIQRAYGLPNKKSITLLFNKDNDPGNLKELEIDVYESAFGVIRFNKRIMTEKEIILDPPEKLDLPGYKGLVAVPSLRDAFIIKMDIVDTSRAGLRLKDQFDILVTLKLCNERGVKLDTPLEAVSATSPYGSVIEKMSALEELFNKPSVMANLPYDYPLLPSAYEIIQALKDVRRFKDYEVRKFIYHFD